MRKRPVPEVFERLRAGENVDLDDVPAGLDVGADGAPEPDWFSEWPEASAPRRPTETVQTKEGVL